jgi:hypothetical protein
VKAHAAALAACAALVVVGAAGCGEDEEEPVATNETPVTATEQTTTIGTATAERETTTGTATTEDEGEVTTDEEERQGTPSGKEDRPPADQGDEEPIRVPAEFTVRGRRITPATVSVPAFLSIELTVASGDGRAHVAVLRAERTYTVRVPAGGRRSIDVVGVRQGRYPLTVDGGRARAALVAGGEPGP